MNKIKALTLIETLLVIVVIALILVVATNQFQRYQQARNIQEAKTAVQLIAEYGSQLYLEHCADMQQQHIQLLCPSSLPSYTGFSAKDAQYCNDSFTIVNPFLLAPAQSGIVNYTINVSIVTGVPIVSIGLPMSSSFLGSLKGKSGAQIVASPLFQKYMAALQPTAVTFEKEAASYFPGVGWETNINDPFDNICLTGSQQDVCMIWRISPANWGPVATNVVANQGQVNQLAAFAGQYAPRADEWKTIQSQNGTAIINCPGINAQTVYQSNN
jgi:type II secretory pathway pseudopilin PulG